MAVHDRPSGESHRGRGAQNHRWRGKLGVVNKIDRAEPEERTKILEHITATVGDQLEGAVCSSPRSKRAATKTTRSSPRATTRASSTRARSKNASSRRHARSKPPRAAPASTRSSRMRSSVSVNAARCSIRIDGHRREQTRAQRLLFECVSLPSERRQMNLDANAVYNACAAEVLEFVRPRRWVFGSNEATPADRDFLIGVLEERLFADFSISPASASANARSPRQA